ncbi:MAG TPA: trigger factor [Candidatus Dormibacteraeota bacterium]|nr:trigger factor [Candidatus Dormibacteraeota bacterium]
MTAADVSVVTETLPGSQVGLKIEVPPEQVDRAYERVLGRLAQKVRIEGFRPGRAPRPLIEARLGPAAIREEVVEALVPPVVARALQDHDIDAIDRPQVEVHELERGRPGRFTARVSVMPDVTLPDLDTLRVERSHTTVDDERVEDRLLELRDRLAEVEPVDREAQVGDLVVADLRVLVDGREVPSEARTATEVELREGVVIPELLAAVPGHRVGEVAAADVTLPEEHSNPDLRGRPARLEVAVQGVKQKHVPELTDEIAAELSGGEQTTAAGLRDAVRRDLEEQARRIDELAFEQAAVKAVVDASQVELPVALVDREVEHRLEEMERSLQRRGLRLDRYLQYVDKSAAQYREEIRPDAESRVRVDLVLDQLGRRFETSPSDDEVRAHMEAEAERDEQVRSELPALLGNAVAVDYFRHRLTRLRILEALVKRLGGAAEVADANQAPGLKGMNAE